jgi:hypothetical protein
MALEIGGAGFAPTSPSTGSGFGVTRRTDRAERTAEAQGNGKAERSPAEERQIAELRRVDRAVRAHESAHLAAGAGVVSGGARFQFTVGPDGKRYAVGGEVPIDSSPGRTPEDTLAKAQIIRRAALAPADPSATDRRVAAQAAAMEAEARAAIREAARAEAEGVRGGPNEDGSDRRLSLYRDVEADAPAATAFSARA